MRWLLALAPLSLVALAADPPAKPAAPPGKPAAEPLKITPGKVVIPTDRMRRIWGEVVSVDPANRTGVFRNESTDELMTFKVTPYAELLHHAARGDLQDFRVGERAIFRLHEDAEGKWVWLTYIQDEMNFQAGHKEYYWVDAVDATAGTIAFTQANADKSFVREKGLTMETDANTRYWKGGRPAAFADIKVGDKLLAKTHGVGKGKRRVCWELFLDDESRDKFRDEQRAVHLKRMADDGLPGYVDAADGSTLKLTVFPEAMDVAKGLKAGRKVRVAPAGVDRKPTAPPAAGTLTAIKAGRGNVHEATITLAAPATGFAPAGLFRVWAE